MILKLSIFAAAFAAMVLGFAMSSPAFAADYNKDDPKMQEAINQDGTTQATSGTSADCPTGQCPKYFAPGYQNEGAAIEPADATAPNVPPASSTKTKK